MELRLNGNLTNLGLAFLVTLMSAGTITAEAVEVTLTGPDAAATPTQLGSCVCGPNCTLRAAVQLANNCPGIDEIRLPSGTFALSINGPGGAEEGDLDVTADVRIIGAKADTAIVAAGPTFQDRIFDIEAGATEFTTLAIVGGSAQVGGGIRVGDANLRLTVCQILDNTASDSGGGIYVGPSGTLTIDRLRLRNNTAGFGGAMAISGGSATSPVGRASVFSDNTANSGGGIAVTDGAVVTLDLARVVDNRAVGSGGGLLVRDSTVTLTSSTVSNNEATFGGGVSGTIKLVRSSVVRNVSHGGCGSALEVTGSDSLIELESSTVSQNVSSLDTKGAICVLGGGARLLNSTVSDNIDQGANPAVSIHAQFTEPIEIASSTLTDPILAVGGAAEIRVKGSILVGCGDAVVNSGGHNLFRTGSGCPATGIGDRLAAFNPADPQDPVIGPLGSHGGRTHTRPLPNGSLAIDRGEAACSDWNGALLTADQRGTPRPIGPRCDIGAFEFNPTQSDDGIFGFDSSVALFGSNGFASNQLAVTLTPKWTLRHSGGSTLDLTFPMTWIPESFRGLGHGSLAFPVEDPAPVPVSELEIGPSLIVTPAVEWTFRTEARWSPSILFGLGLMYSEGKSTRLEGLGVFRTPNATAAVMTYGVALSFDLSRQMSLRLEGRGLTALMDDLLVEAPDGSTLRLDGRTVTSGLLSAGLSWRF